MSWPLNAPFPSESFSGLMYSAGQAIQGAVLADTALVGSAVLAACASVVQPLGDVEGLFGCVPTSLNFVIPVEFGGGMTPVWIKAYQDAALAYEQTADEEWTAARHSYRAQHLFWREVKKAVLKTISKNGRVNAEDQEKLQELMASEPQKPTADRLLFRATTSVQALLKTLSQQPVQATTLVIDRGTMFLDKLSPQDLALLCSVCDGSRITVDRLDKASFTIAQPRLTSVIAVNPNMVGRAAPLQRMRDGDLLCRFLPAYSSSHAGSRFHRADDAAHPSFPHYQKRIRDLLELRKAMASRSMQRKLLQLSPEARGVLQNFAYWVESQIAPGYFYSDVQDAGSKAVTHATSIAGVIHYFEGYEGLFISAETMRRATDLSAWYLAEFRRLFGPGGFLSPESIDARLFYKTLRKHLLALGTWDIELSDATGNPPYALRGKTNRQRREAALACLQGWGWIQIHLNSSTKRTFIRVMNGGGLSPVPLSPQNGIVHVPSADATPSGGSLFLPRSNASPRY